MFYDNWIHTSIINWIFFQPQKEPFNRAVITLSSLGFIFLWKKYIYLLLLFQDDRYIYYYFLPPKNKFFVHFCVCCPFRFSLQFFNGWAPLKVIIIAPRASYSLCSPLSYRYGFLFWCIEDYFSTLFLLFYFIFMWCTSPVIIYLGAFLIGTMSNNRQAQRAEQTFSHVIKEKKK